MIDLNISFFIQMANFLLLLFLLNVVLFRPIRGIIQQRREKLADLAAQAEQFRQQMEEADQERQNHLRQAQSDGFERKNDLKNQAAERERSLLAKTNQDLAAEAAQVRSQIQAQIETARQGLLGQVDGFGLALAEKMLGRSLS